MDHTALERLCKNVYFPTEPVADSSPLLMNGMLFYLLTEYSNQDGPNLSAFDCSTYAVLCERSFVLASNDTSPW